MLLTEKNAVAKPTDWLDLMSVAESEATPFTSMARKGVRPKQVSQHWQAKRYPTVGHRGVLDTLDATDFNSNQGEELAGVCQKVWHNVGVSDFAEDNMEQAGVKGSAINNQVADALVTVKRITEKRCLSNEECRRDDGDTSANETRGIFKWSDSSFTLYPVPAAFQTPALSKYSSALASLTEDAFGDLGQSAYKQRKGPVSLDGFVGIELKRRFTEFTVFQPTSGSVTPVRRFNQADSQTLTATIDSLVLDSGKYRLHTSSFLRTDADSGEDSAYTHKSGVFVDMSMVSLAYTRLPRVVKQDYQGGGHKRIIDSIFMLKVDNPLTQIALNINS